MGGSEISGGWCAGGGAVRDAAERLRHTADVACSCPASAWTVGPCLQGCGALGLRFQKTRGAHCSNGWSPRGRRSRVAEGRWEVGAQSGPFTEQERPRARRSHPAASTEPPGTRSCPSFVSEELYRGARRAGSRRSGGHENAGHGAVASGHSEGQESTCSLAGGRKWAQSLTTQPRASGAPPGTAARFH